MSAKTFTLVESGWKRADGFGSPLLIWVWSASSAQRGDMAAKSPQKRPRPKSILALDMAIHGLKTLNRCQSLSLKDSENAGGSFAPFFDFERQSENITAFRGKLRGVSEIFDDEFAGSQQNLMRWKRRLEGF